MVVLLTHVLYPRKKHVSHLTSAVRLACSTLVLARAAAGRRPQLLGFAQVTGRNGFALTPTDRWVRACSLSLCLVGS